MTIDYSFGSKAREDFRTVRGDEGIEPYVLSNASFAIPGRRGAANANISVERGGYNQTCWYAVVNFDRIPRKGGYSWEQKITDGLPSKLIVTLNGPGKNKMLQKVSSMASILYGVRRNIRDLPKPLTHGKLRKQAKNRALREKNPRRSSSSFW